MTSRYTHRAKILGFSKTSRGGLLSRIGRGLGMAPPAPVRMGMGKKLGLAGLGTLGLAGGTYGGAHALGYGEEANELIRQAAQGVYEPAKGLAAQLMGQFEPEKGLDADLSKGRQSYDDELRGRARNSVDLLNKSQDARFGIDDEWIRQMGYAFNNSVVGQGAGMANISDKVTPPKGFRLEDMGVDSYSSNPYGNNYHPIARQLNNENFYDYLEREGNTPLTQ